MEAKSEGNGERKGKSRAACDSGRKGDYRYKSCAPFCKEVNGKSHCTFCKCMTCSFCINPNASTSSSSLARARNKEPLVPTSLASSAKEHKEELQASLQDYRRSTGSGPLVASLQAALRESELRVASLESQLHLCKSSAARLRDGRERDEPLPLASTPPPSSHGNQSSLSLAAVALNPRCSQSVAWAQRVGVKAYPELYPGLNSSSPAWLFQRHLHHYDFDVSRCPDPRPGEKWKPADGGSDNLSSVLLLLAVLATALCNAHALGYVQPGRRLRALARLLGFPIEPLVR